MKPYKGSIKGVRKDIDLSNFPDLYPKNLGYIITGYFVDHPDFMHSSGWTSLIVTKGPWKTNKAGVKSCEVETLNSRYTWISS